MICPHHLGEEFLHPCLANPKLDGCFFREHPDLCGWYWHHAATGIANFHPTPACINALPEPLRRYLHDLETMSDPAGLIQENFTLRTQNEQLQAYINSLHS